MDSGHSISSDGGRVASPGIPVRTEEAVENPSEPSTLYLEPATDVPRSTDETAIHEGERLDYLLHVSIQRPTTPTLPFLRPLLHYIHHREDRLMGTLAGLSPPAPLASLESETLSSRTNIPLLGVGAWTEGEAPMLENRSNGLECMGETNGVGDVFMALRSYSLKLCRALLGIVVDLSAQLRRILFSRKSCTGPAYSGDATSMG
ncbi:hypothetical protein CHU98_g10676 [Xylaria longipes]|nr:hypothetical protein CHU98_g10676 [Xylaria longipes]